MGSLPNFLWYAATNSAFPGDFSASNQSPEVKMPLMLLGPTLSGKFTGSFAPLDRNRNLGLRFCSTMAFTSANPSSTWVPPMTMSGFAAAIFETIGDRSVVSGGYTCL